MSPSEAGLFDLATYTGCITKFGNISSTKAEFLDAIKTKVLTFSSLLFTVTATNGFYSPSPPTTRSKKGLKLVCDVNIVYENLKSENSQDYAQKP